jgi:hypothetical protein
LATSHREGAYLPEPEGLADQMAYDPNGNLHFVYTAAVPGQKSSEIFYRRLDRSTGILGPAFPLPSSSDVNVAPGLRLDDAGRVHVTWLEVSPREDRNLVRYARLLGSELAVEMVHSFDVGSAKPNPRLEIAGGGSSLWCLFAVGETGKPWKFAAMKSVDRGHHWALEEELFCGLSCGDRRIRTLHVTESEGWLAVWSRRTETGEQVVARLWASPSGWTPEQVVSDGGGGVVLSPRVAAHGNAVAVAWEIRRLNRRQIAADHSPNGGRSWGQDRVWELDAERGDFDLFFHGGRFSLLEWGVEGPLLSPLSRIRTWALESSKTPSNEIALELEGAIRELALARHPEAVTVVGLVQSLDEPLRLMLVDGGLGEPRWIDLDGRGVYYDGLGVSQGAFGGRFVAGFRRHRPVGFMRGASLDNAMLILAELEAAESVESGPGG